MIAAPEALGVDAGAAVLARGGNAIDAAVTCAFAQGVVDPHDSSIGGFALLNVRFADGNADPTILDAPATAGSLASPDMWSDAYLGPAPGGWGFRLRGRINESGYGSICTPGMLRGLATMLERWGTIPLAEALEPAARIAEEGFAVDNRVAGYWQSPSPYAGMPDLFDQLKAQPEASRLYLKPDGRPYMTGETIRNPDYAATLRHLASVGADDFYSGDLAGRISSDLARGGAAVTASDLANYRIRDRQPATTTFREWTVATGPAPHGGPTMLEILNIVEGWDLESRGHNSPEYISRVAMAMKAAFADRSRYLGDPAFADVPQEWLVGKERAAWWRARIDAGEEIGPDVARPTGASPGTTHVSVVDRDGTCVALTHSLGGSSNVIGPGLGFMYNNSMINFHPLPGHPNSIAPGKGRTTGMTPTIVSRDGKPVLVIGAPGATRIITAVAQVILNHLVFGMPIQEAVLAPRFDAQFGPIACQIRIPASVVAEVARRHPIERLAFGHGGFALVHAVAIDPATGALSGAADTGAAGMAIGV
jgi:gamma-glutamyltranspeptidase/glutathione hydrolase